MNKTWPLRLLAFSILMFFLGSWLLLGVENNDLEVKGQEASSELAYISLATGIVSLLTSIVGLLKAYLDARKPPQDN